MEPCACPACSEPTIVNPLTNVEEYLGCFHFLATVKAVDTKICIQVFVWTKTLFFGNMWE